MRLASATRCFSSRPCWPSVPALYLAPPAANTDVSAPQATAPDALASDPTLQTAAGTRLGAGHAAAFALLLAGAALAFYLRRGTQTEEAAALIEPLGNLKLAPNQQLPARCVWRGRPPPERDGNRHHVAEKLHARGVRGTPSRRRRGADVCCSFPRPQRASGRLCPRAPAACRPLSDAAQQRETHRSGDDVRSAMLKDFSLIRGRRLLLLLAFGLLLLSVVPDAAWAQSAPTSGGGASPLPKISLVEGDKDYELPIQLLLLITVLLAGPGHHHADDELHAAGGRLQHPPHRHRHAAVAADAGHHRPLAVPDAVYHVPRFRRDPR